MLFEMEVVFEEGEGVVAGFIDLLIGDFSTSEISCCMIKSE